MPRSCGIVRPDGTRNQEAEKILYKASLVDADTQYCHHLTENGEHVVLNNLPLSSANKCPGIMYYKIGWTGRYFKCGEPRDHGHDPCTRERCPYLRDNHYCPYSLP